MEVLLSGKTLRLEARHLLGSGGEANVFTRGGEAIKVFHKPSKTKEEKLKRLLGMKLPERVLAPKALVFSKSGQVVGYSMPLAQTGTEPLKMLANRNFRTANQIEMPKVVQIYADFHDTLSELHRLGVVVGDLNDLNELFVGSEVFFIDSDSFQLAGIPCEVATEDFLSPSLYDKGLGGKAVFTPESDWYSYSVLLYRSLLLVHPYGGVYPKLGKLTDRAKNRITALDPGVKYPKLGVNPEALSDEMLAEFQRIFKEGRYGTFPRETLLDFGAGLRTCSNCGQSIWAKRKSCPVCSKAVVPPVTVVTGAYRARLILETTGSILFTAVSGGKFYAVTNEADRLYLTAWHGTGTKTKLFAFAPNLEFGLAARNLVVGKKGSEKLVMVDSASGQVTLSTETELYGGRPAFSGTERYLYRVAGGYLLRGEVIGGELREKFITGVLSGQTWIAADDSNGHERVFLAGRYFENWDFRLVVDDEARDLSVTNLASSEKLVRASVRFGKREILFLRETKKRGKTFLRCDLVAETGELLASDTVEWTEEYEAYFEGAYSQGVLVYSHDDGIAAVKPQTGEKWTFKGTESFTKGGEKLIALGGKLISVTDKKVTLLSQ